MPSLQETSPSPLERPKPKAPPSKGAVTRQTILSRAMDLASSHGLEGLTIGTLADELGMSKSGLFAHFGSKEELQVATVEAAREVFSERVLKVGLRAPKGLPSTSSLKFV